MIFFLKKCVKFEIYKIEIWGAVKGLKNKMAAINKWPPAISTKVQQEQRTQKEQKMHLRTRY